MAYGGSSFLLRWASALIILLVLWGCGVPTNIPPLTPDEIPRILAAANFPHLNYRLESGDKIQIRYTFHPEVDQEEIVRPDGRITASMVGEIAVSGLTTTELEELLVERTSDRLRDPEVVVTITRFGEKNVYVAGEVGNPRAISYQRGLTPLQAIAAAGGFLETASLDSVILVRKGAAGGIGDDSVIRKLNLAEVINEGVKEPLQLAPHDILFVPKTPIANAGLWVRQHITDMIPIRPPSTRIP